MIRQFGLVYNDGPLRGGAEEFKAARRHSPAIQAR